MATLLVPVTANFSSANLVNIDLIDFTNTFAAASATFAHTQFNNSAILNGVTFDGSVQPNYIVVSGGSVNASGWQFANWTPAFDTITIDGGIGADTIIGSLQRDAINGGDGNDVITGGLGADALVGGIGNDTFVYNSVAELAAGETIDGSAGSADAIRIGQIVIDFTTFTLTGIERAEFGGGAGSLLYLTGAQLGAGAITTVTGSATADRLWVKDSTTVNLSGVAVANWLSNDSISIFGTGGADSVIGSVRDDTIHSSVGTDTYAGGNGNDTVLYNNSGDITSGEAVDGGAGTADEIELAFSGNYQLSTLAISNVEILDVGHNQFGEANTATLSASQIGTGAITTVDGGGGTDALVVNGLNVDLSGVAFTNWTAGTDTITINGSLGFTDLRGSSLADTINGQGFDDTIYGNGGDDTLNGFGGNDEFRFDENDDADPGLAIDGGTGTLDSIIIDAGTDHSFYFADIVGVERLELLGGDQRVSLTGNHVGAGRINTFLASAVGASNIAVYTFNGTQAIDLSSATLSNFSTGDRFTLYGSSESDDAEGSVFDDTLWGQQGDDLLLGGAGNDRFLFSDGTDVDGTSLTGEYIDGGSGLLDRISLSGTGVNTIDFTAENIVNVEVLAFESAAWTAALSNSQIGNGPGSIEIVDGNGNINHVIVHGGAINLSGVVFAQWTNGTDSITLFGLGSADTLTGSSQSDTIDGAAGADGMSGGFGNDSYYVDNALDTVTELSGAGSDFIYTSVTYTLAANTERLFLMGTDNINGTGLNGQADVLTGNLGNNILNGLTGNDILRGGQGNDTYLVDSGGDVVEENTGYGTDAIKSIVTFTMAANTERLYLIGSAAIDGTGLAAKNDLIVGNGAANKLNGLSGNDTLTGGLGADTFVFTTALNAATNHDTITDFNIAADTIQLENAIFTLLPVIGPMALAFFKDLSLGAQDANDVVIYDRVNGDLYYDSNGIAAGGQILFADVTNNTALTFADFVVV